VRHLGQLRVDRSRVALIAGLGIDNFGSGLFLPLSIVYATRVLDLDVGTAGVAIGVASALGLAVPPVAGRMTVGLGPRRTVVLAQLVQGAGALAYLLAHGVSGAFAAAGLMAIGAQLFYCSVFVLIADMSTNEAKERPFALVAMIRSGAFALGTFTAALALAHSSDSALRWLVGADAGTFGVAALLLGLFVRTSLVAHNSAIRAGPMTVFRDRCYLELMAAVCLLDLTVDFALVGTPVFILHVINGPVWFPESC
jgi:MFS family permease